MGSVKSEVGSTYGVGSILHGEFIYLVSDHYDTLAYTTLCTKAEALGAQITDRYDASIIIVNENSPLWDEHARESLLNDIDKSEDPVILPYHWLSVCQHRKRRVEVEDLPVEIPYMVQSLTDRYPLKVWVSKNVQRDVGEEAKDAYDNVVAQLESVGALAVAKRAHADVLIVDMASNFYNTVKKEKEDNQRDWQKLAQRDWVEFCITNRTLQLATQRDEERSTAGSENGGTRDMEVDQNGDDVDSMVEEDSPVRRGPGRPTGKPRVEYTPEDDDFLCRYLAYYNPDGSWVSRKTYQALVSDQLGYPLAARHTSQSWHERFKKNQAAFGRRVTRFINEKVDRSLKTATERAAAAEKRAAREPEPEQIGRRSETAREVPAASTSRQAETTPPVVLVPETVPLAQPSDDRPQGVPKRALVAADSRSPTPEPPASKIDAKGKRREVEPIAGPSRSVGETVESHTRAEPGSAITGISATSGVDDRPLNKQASVPAAIGGSASITDTTIAAGVDEPSTINEEPQFTTQALPKKERKRVSEIDVPAYPTSDLVVSSKSRRHETPINNEDHRVPQGSTPLRQEIERSNEKRRREHHRKHHGHGPASRRLSKRASSPDKVYAYVNLPPPRPIIAPVQETTPEPPRSRTPPRELTPAEREQSVLAGSRIVQDIAAQYRLKVAALGKKFGVGITEISAATNEVKRRNGGKSAVDWNMLEMVLQEQYGH